MTVEEIRAGLNEAAALAAGPAKAERLERLAAAARAGEDRAIEATVLAALITAYEFGAESDVLPVPFARLLRLLDEYPAEVGGLTRRIHWQLKWLTSELVSSPSIPLPTIERWFDEVTSRFRQAGHSPRPVLARRAQLAQHLGDQAAADAAMEQSMVAPRDSMADCEACERNDWGTWRAGADDDERALEHWGPVLDGRLRCAEEPHRVLAQALLPLMRTGRHERARSAYLTGYPLARREVNLRRAVGYHIEFCALTGNEAHGLEILAEHADWLVDAHHSVEQRLSFVTGVSVLLRRLADLGHGDLPVGEKTAASVLAALETEIDDICARFDTRNGTTVVGDRTRQRLAQAPLVEWLPLGATRALPEQPPGRPASARRANGSLDDLVEEAGRLVRDRHPGADAAWRRVAATGADLPEPAATELARSAANPLFESDPAAAREALLAVAERFGRLDLPGHALEARAAAAVAGGRAYAAARATAEAETAAPADGAADGARAEAGTGAEAEAGALAVEADEAHAAGRVTAREFLAARRARPMIVMHALAARQERFADEIGRARAAVEDEFTRVRELGDLRYTGFYQDMLAQLALWESDVEAARGHLRAARDAYVDVGEPWHAARPAAALAQMALRDGDPAAAEDLVRSALRDGRYGVLSRVETAQLSSLLVAALAVQPDRGLDVVEAALNAAGQWEGISEPDALHGTFTAARAYHDLRRHAEAVALFAEVMPRVEDVYDATSAALTRQKYADSLAAVRRFRDAAGQYLQAARLVQDDPHNRYPHAQLAWSAAEMLQRSGRGTEAVAAYERSIALWTELGESVPRVRCLRSAAWLRHGAWLGEAGLHADPAESPSVAEMRALLTELEASEPFEGKDAELEATREQITEMLNTTFYDDEE